MNTIHIKWELRSSKIAPTLSAIGTSESKDSREIMIQNALEIIDLAASYNGFPVQPDSPVVTKSKVTVSFTLMFKTKTECDNFFNILAPNS